MATIPTALVSGAGGALAPIVIARLVEFGWRTVGIRSPRDPGGEDRSVDLADEEATRRAVLAIEDETGGIDAVVHLAGSFGRSLAVDVTADALRRQLEANLLSAVTLTTAALPAMLERRRGVIVGIAAGQALDGGAGASAYAASKAALAAYLRSVDRELAPRGVRTVVVYPVGTIDTSANRAAMPSVDPAGWISSEAMAQSIVTAITLGPRGRLKELQVYPDER